MCCPPHPKRSTRSVRGDYLSGLRRRPILAVLGVRAGLHNTVPPRLRIRAGSLRFRAGDTLPQTVYKHIVIVICEHVMCRYGHAPLWDRPQSSSARFRYLRQATCCWYIYIHEDTSPKTIQTRWKTKQKSNKSNPTDLDTIESVESDLPGRLRRLTHLRKNL